MFFVLLPMFVFLFVAAISALINNQSTKTAVASIGTSAGSLVGLVSLFWPQVGIGNVIKIATNIPLITFSFGIDSLSRFFLFVIYLISFFAGLYGFGYLRDQKKLSTTVAFFPLLISAMAGVVISRDGLSFLILWEIMSLVSFLLVTTEHENKEVQNAGWIYLVATHLATAFLMVLFVIMAGESGSLLFDGFTIARSPLMAGLLFIFAVIGFGTKAGIFPFHIWLPHAHPAAPSYISAIMSGIMIKTGIYGIVRVITFLGVPPLWWGMVLVALGVVSAVAGVLYALMQHDLKRLLAYHSVENIGIIVVGLGIGLIGLSHKNALVAMLGFGGALFHVLNHAIFKSLLFMCAGCVAHATHTLAIDRLGGLIKKMPFTSLIFLVAALSICGLPPFNGFISEWLVYVGLFNATGLFTGYSVLLSVLGVLGVVFAGGLAVACFTKVFGVVFLGESRSEIPKDCVESSWSLLAPMFVLAFFCLFLGLFPGTVLPMIFDAAQSVSSGLNAGAADTVVLSINKMGLLFFGMILFAVLLIFIRKLVFRKRDISTAPTWDCGYAFPTARMQYTAASFAEPIGIFFKAFLNPRLHFHRLSGIFPAKEVFEEHILDRAENSLFRPLFESVGRFLLFVRHRRKSTVQSYLTLIFVTLIILFVLEVWLGI